MGGHERAVPRRADRRGAATRLGAFGIVSRFDYWIRQHNVSPSLLIALTAWLSYGIAQDADEQKVKQARQQQTDRNPEPPTN